MIPDESIAIHKWRSQGYLPKSRYSKFLKQAEFQGNELEILLPKGLQKLFSRKSPIIGETKSLFYVTSCQYLLAREIGRSFAQKKVQRGKGGREGTDRQKEKVAPTKGNTKKRGTTTKNKTKGQKKQHE